MIKSETRSYSPHVVELGGTKLGASMIVGRIVVIMALERKTRTSVKQAGTMLTCLLRPPYGIVRVLGG